ncbi:unnamed protein product [Didymodactylos carnosus]|uniref:Uncharacterized protein n=1 Tax=Didymodactylos carnosus TaxID=1234261 RepID=A0A814XMH1_9BILA|nr:unnamed protein product [Didymodactylos carnosus]CAF3982425.1 unnamed protein product [Didymodactylos carnosus]
MLSISTLFVLISIGLVYNTPVRGKSCEAQVYNSPGVCESRLFIPQPCDSATLELGATNFKTCTDVRLSWDYPTNNLTMIIETPFTQQRQPYAVNLDSYWMFGGKTYRVLDGKETELKSDGKAAPQKSDSNYQVIFKLQFPPSLTLYGLSSGELLGVAVTRLEAGGSCDALVGRSSWWPLDRSPIMEELIEPALVRPMPLIQQLSLTASFIRNCSFRYDDQALARVVECGHCKRLKSEAIQAPGCISFSPLGYEQRSEHAVSALLGKSV